MKSLVWFRNNLRVTDNPSLVKACENDAVIAVYCFDPSHFEDGGHGFKKTEKFRAQFLIETVHDLRTQLEALHISLLVFFESPENVIPELVLTHHISSIYLQKEWTSEEYEVFQKVKTQCSETVQFFESYDQLLYHPQDIPFEGFKHIPDVFTAFRKKVEKYGTIRPVLEKPTKKAITNLLDTPTKIPNLNDLGLDNFELDKRSAFSFKGGESQALQRLQSYFWDSRHLATYKKTRNGLIGPAYSSKFSPWLANGSISAKAIYWAVRDFENKIIKNQDTYWLIFELIWRDFFKYISLKHGNGIFYLGGILNREYDWKNSKKYREKWISGKTNEPFVNANMNEIALTGWMSNRGRQNVASYWAKELCQDWRVGAAYFESMLLDYDVHSNWCNWMYLSGVGNDPRDRKFNIQRQSNMYDPENTYQKLWLS